MRGNNMWRFVVLMALCLVAAPAAVQAQTSTVRDSANCTKVGPATVCPTLNTVKVSLTTRTRSSLSVSTSTDTGFGQTVLDSRPKVTHIVTIPEYPATNYHIKLTVSPVSGKPSTFVGTFTTDELDSVPAVVTNQGGKLALNGIRLFLTSAWVNDCLDAPTAEADIKLDVLMLYGHACLDSSNPESVKQFAGLLQYQTQKVWWHEDEAATAQQLSSVSLLLGWQASNSELGTFPQVTPCIGDLGGLPGWLKMQAKLIAQNSAKRAEIPYALVATQLTPSVANCLTPAWLNAYFWTAAIKGVSGMTYDTHQEDHAGAVPDYSVNAAIKTQIIKQDNCMKTLEATVMYGKPLTAKTSSDNLELGAWSYGGVVYIAAVNADSSPASASISLPQLSKSKTVQTVCEAPSSLKLEGSSFTARFGIAGVHIYKALPSPISKKK